jgi:hypothetical protein
MLRKVTLSINVGAWTKDIVMDSGYMKDQLACKNQEAIKDFATYHG